MTQEFEQNQTRSFAVDNYSKWHSSNFLIKPDDKQTTCVSHMLACFIKLRAHLLWLEFKSNFHSLKKLMPLDVPLDFVEYQVIDHGVSLSWRSHF